MHGAPFWVCYDHDDDCRRAIGSPLAIWVGYRASEFHLTRGEPKSFSKRRGIARTFCAECGTSISYSDAALPEEVYLSVGFFDHPEVFQPRAHAFWHLKLPCLDFSDDLPKMSGYSRARHSAPAESADR